MPGETLRLAVRLTADGKDLVGDVQVSKRAVREFAQETRKASRATGRRTAAQRRATAEERKAARAAREAAKAQREAERAERRRIQTIRQRGAAIAAGFGAGIGLTAGIQLARRTAAAVIDVADANVELRNRLRLVTDSEEELERTRSRLLDVSVETRTELGANAALYSRLALAADNLSREDIDLTRIVRTLNQQLAIGGSNAREGAQGLIQFAQGIASGRLQGDELRSVMENLLGVQQGLIDGFNILYQRGEISFRVTRQNIRELASEGTLTSDLLIRAIDASADVTERRYGEIVHGFRAELSTLREELKAFLDESVSLQGPAAGVSGLSGELAAARRRRALLERTLGYIDQPLGQRSFIGQTDQEVAGLLRRYEGELEGLGDIIDAQSIVGRQARAALLQRIAAVERELAQRERPGDIPTLPTELPAGVAGALERDRRSEELRAAREGESGASQAARAFLALQQQSLDQEEQIQAAYRATIDLVETYGHALDDGGASLRAYAERTRRVALANTDAAKAERARIAAATSAGEELARLADENERIAAGGLLAVEQIEREREQRELIMGVIREHANVSVEMQQAIITEKLNRMGLLEVLEQEAEARERVRQATYGLLEQQELLPGVGGVEQTERLQATWYEYAAAIGQVEGALAQLAATSPERARKLFRIQKAVALAGAIVNTAAGVTHALKDYSPPTSFVLAGLVAAAGAIQIAAIRAQEPQGFRYGGIIDRRVDFTYGGGRRGFAGEAGPEAILPLQQGPRGLGIADYGGGRQVSFGDIHLSVTIQAPEGTSDAEAFAREAAGAIERQLEPIVNRIMVRQQSPGGVLNPTSTAA